MSCSNAIPWRRRVVSIAVTALGTRWEPMRPAGSSGKSRKSSTAPRRKDPPRIQRCAEAENRVSGRASLVIGLGLAGRSDIAPDRGLTDLEFGRADHATGHGAPARTSSGSRSGRGLPRIASRASSASISLGAENSVHCEATVGRGDADCARDSAGGSLNG